MGMEGLFGQSLRTENLKTYRRAALKIAKQLCYSEKALEKIKEATSIPQVDRIMRSARRGDI